MKITHFKKRYLQLSIEEQKTVISEMKKADVSKDHMEGIEPSLAPQMEKEFKDLIQWCIDNQKDSIANKINEITK